MGNTDIKPSNNIHRIIHSDVLLMSIALFGFINWIYKLICDFLTIKTQYMLKTAMILRLLLFVIIFMRLFNFMTRTFVANMLASTPGN